MESISKEHSGRIYHVLGIEFSDSALMERSKRVVQSCMALLVIIIARGVTFLAMGEPVGPALLSLLFNFAIPAFGFLAARHSSRLLMGTFLGLMVLNAIVGIVVLVILSHAMTTNTPQRLPSGLIQPFKMSTSLWIQFGFIGPWVVLVLVGAYHAYKLFSHLLRGDLALRSEDAECELPQMEFGSSGVEPQSFGLPSGGGAFYERDIDVEFHSAIRRKKVEGTEMRGLRSSTASPRA